MILVGKLMYLYMVYGSETDENRHFSLFTVKSCFVMRLPLRLPGSLVVCLLEDNLATAVEVLLGGVKSGIPLCPKRQSRF